MMRLRVAGLALGLAAVCVVTASSQPPDGQPPKGPGKKDGFGRGKNGGPPRFEPGRVLPPFVREQLNLNAEQQQQLDALERDVKDRLRKILTEKQLQQLKELRLPGPPNGGPAGRGGEKKGPGGGPGEEDSQVRGNVSGGIQWFATWESGRREAARSDRPILLVSAAPHCAGVPGIW